MVKEVDERGSMATALTDDGAFLIIQHYPYLPSSLKSKGWTFMHE